MVLLCLRKTLPIIPYHYTHISLSIDQREKKSVFDELWGLHSQTVLFKVSQKRAFGFK